MGKKMLILIGSRNANGNTSKFAKRITNFLDSSYEKEFIFPQDLSLNAIDGSNFYFTDLNYNATTSLKTLKQKILKSDILIVGSPVYVHSISSDLKLLIENLASWAHTLRLQGKPTVVLSTCGSNGFDTVIKPLSEVLTFMGANVIATANASQIPNQINNDDWLNEVGSTIAERIEKYAYKGAESNEFLERVFKASKINILEQRKAQMEHEINISELGELKYWEDTEMINFDSFQDYLDNRRGVNKNELKNI